MIIFNNKRFLDKELISVADYQNHNGAHSIKNGVGRIWDHLIIKTQITLQGFYSFEDNLRWKQLEKHFDFYEPFTVHESSLRIVVTAFRLRN